LVRRKVAVIVAGTTSAAFAAKAATATIPIVFTTPEDPVTLGLVASLARPGGNLTGINWLAGELTAKRLELLHELVPGAARIALLVEPNNARITETTVRDAEVAARSMGLQIRVLNANTSGEIDAAFAKMQRPSAPAASCCGLLDNQSPLLVHGQARLPCLLKHRRMPVNLARVRTADDIAIRSASGASVRLLKPR
jgi:putative ABC transport system substrate-binding protein